MRHVNGLYTQRYNRLHGGPDGPLFRGRHKAILVEADAYLLHLTRYIHRNPVETRRALVEALRREIEAESATRKDVKSQIQRLTS